MLVLVLLFVVHSFALARRFSVGVAVCARLCAYVHAAESVYVGISFSSLVRCAVVIDAVAVATTRCFCEQIYIETVLRYTLPSVLDRYVFAVVVSSV